MTQIISQSISQSSVIIIWTSSVFKKNNIDLAIGYFFLTKNNRIFTENILLNLNLCTRLTLIVLMIVFVLSFLFVSLLCGAVLARNASIIFSEFRSFSSSSNLSTCFSCGFVLCFIDPSLRGIFLEEESLLLWPAENEKHKYRTFLKPMMLVRRFHPEKKGISF